MSGRARIIVGDAAAGLALLEPESVRCCVTSPPYWGLRDYGFAGQIGLEPTPEAYIRTMVEVFQHVRRVLAHDGTLWVNVGDTYAGARKGGHQAGSELQGRNAGSTVSRRRDNAMVPRSDLRIDGAKSKDLVGIPWMLAFALRADGWYLRSDIIWAKPNPMPESVRDRPTKSHEYLFLLSKSARYFYNAKAIAEKVMPSSQRRLAQDVDQQHGSTRANGRTRADRPMKALGNNGVGWGYTEGKDAKPRTLRDRTPSGWDQLETSDHHQLKGRYSSGNKERKRRDKEPGAVSGTNQNQAYGVPWTDLTGTRNARTVWSIPTQPFAEAHFATFPEALARRCVLAGSAPGDTVLDPFGGSGTVALVATSLRRGAVHIDAQPDYTAMAMHRIGPVLCDVEHAP